jgi:uncharacterized membrane protein YbhN (UPF0104 family)
MLLSIINHMKKNKLYLIISLGLLVLTIAVFSRYISTHFNLIDRLKTTSPIIIFWLLLLYGLWFCCLALILKFSLNICGIKLSNKENFLLNAYSTIVNFFVPGQGGPAVRGAYLLKKYKLRIRTYILLILIYYMIYGVANSFLALSTTAWWWILIPLVIGAVGVSLYGGRKYISKFKISSSELRINPKSLSYLAIATLAQIAIVVVINLIELHAVNSGATFKQILIYTGVENLTVFIALTPGAIGIREAFLIFSQKLHHISTSNIVSANIIDRSIFLVVLGLLLVYVLVTHARQKLNISIKKLPS